MNRIHIGDAKDFAKGQVFAILREANLVAGPAVVPLFTPPDPTPNEIQTYLAVMRLANQHLVSTALLPNGQASRAVYFQGVLNAATELQTLFVDPDKGIRTNNNPSQEHVLLSEILSLLAINKDRILIVYDEAFGRATQEVRRQDMANRLGEFRQHGCVCFYYYGVTVNLLFVGNRFSEQRLALIQNHLANLLVGTPYRVVV
jgi:hypothetical protein